MATRNDLSARLRYLLDLSQATPVWVGVYILCVVFAFLIPTDVFIQYPLSKRFTGVMTTIVPQIERLALLRENAEWALFYCSVLWAIGFASMPLFCLCRVINILECGMKRTMPKFDKEFIPAMIGSWVFTYLIVFLPDIVLGTDPLYTRGLKVLIDGDPSFILLAPIVIGIGIIVTSMLILSPLFLLYDSTNLFNFLKPRDRIKKANVD